MGVIVKIEPKRDKIVLKILGKCDIILKSKKHFYTFLFGGMHNEKNIIITIGFGFNFFNVF